MKKSALAFAALLLAFSLSAQKSTTRTLSNFSTINISGGCDQLILVPGSKDEIKIEASDSDLDKIEAVANKNSLNISVKDGVGSLSGRSKITVTFQNLSQINSSGNTDIETRGAIKADKFTFNASGSGDFKAELDVKTLSVAISGTSDITLKGEAEEQKYAISGSGDINAANCSGQTASVACSGSGDVDLNVSGKVKTAISGSGSVNNKRSH